MKARGGKRQHHLAPTIGKLRVSMQEKHAGAAFLLEPCLEHMKRKAIDIADITRAYPGRKRDRRKLCSIGLNDCSTRKILRNRTGGRASCG
jgi:hypothetical protein